MIDTTLPSKDYATSGLRTLCLTHRDISEAEYREWLATYDQVVVFISGHVETLDTAAKIIEKHMTLLGAAVEGKNQEGAPDTIHALEIAGIKVKLIYLSDFTLI